MLILFINQRKINNHFKDLEKQIPTLKLFPTLKWRKPAQRPFKCQREMITVSLITLATGSLPQAKGLWWWPRLFTLIMIHSPTKQALLDTIHVIKLSYYFDKFHGNVVVLMLYIFPANTDKYNWLLFISSHYKSWSFKCYFVNFHGNENCALPLEVLRVKWF